MTKMNTAVKQTDQSWRIIGMNVCIWLFDYNKQCGIARERCIFTIDRPSSLQQSAKGSLFWAKTSTRLWWEKQGCNQWQVLWRAIDEKWILHVSSGEETTAHFLKPHSLVWTATLETFLNIKEDDTVVLSYVGLSGPKINSIPSLWQECIRF